MPHTIAYNSELHILEIKFLGKILVDEIVQTGWEAAKLLAEKRCSLVLSDYREAILDMPLTEIYSIPDKIGEIVLAEGRKIYEIRRAFVSQGSEEAFHFFETTSLNRGHRLKQFCDMDEARKWLLNK